MPPTDRSTDEGRENGSIFAHRLVRSRDKTLRASIFLARCHSRQQRRQRRARTTAVTSVFTRNDAARGHAAQGVGADAGAGWWVGGGGGGNGNGGGRRRIAARGGVTGRNVIFDGI